MNASQVKAMEQTIQHIRGRIPLQGRQRSLTACANQAKQMLLAAVQASALCLVGVLSCSAAQEPAGNAAMKYWQAFAQMPTLDRDQQRRIIEWKTVSLDAPTLRLVESFDISLLYLHRGARLNNCYWELDLDDGPELLLPHLQKSRDLARAAMIRARYRLHEKQTSEAADDLIAAMKLGRHSGSDAVMVSVLVGMAIEEMAIETLASYLPDLQPPLRDRIAEGIAALPKNKTIKDTMTTERYLAAWLSKKLESNTSLDSLEQSLPGILRATKQVGGRPQAVAMLNQFSDYYGEAEEAMDLPREEAMAALDKLEKKYETNPFAKTFMPACGRALDAEHRIQAKRAMLAAALDLLQSPGDRVEARDPFGKGPLKFSKTRDGFQLRSRLILRGKETILQVGRSSNVAKSRRSKN